MGVGSHYSEKLPKLPGVVLGVGSGNCEKQLKLPVVVLGVGSENCEKQPKLPLGVLGVGSTDGHFGLKLPLLPPPQNIQYFRVVKIIKSHKHLIIRIIKLLLAEFE